MLIEAKVGQPADFIIRQLFYPYRKPTRLRAWLHWLQSATGAVEVSQTGFSLRQTHFNTSVGAATIFTGLSLQLETASLRHEHHVVGNLRIAIDDHDGELNAGGRRRPAKVPVRSNAAAAKHIPHSDPGKKVGHMLEAVTLAHPKLDNAGFLS